MTLRDDATIAAGFVVNCHRLIVNTSGSGGVALNPTGNCPDGSSRYIPGSSVQLTPVANTGWYFNDWGGDCAGQSSLCTLVLSAERSVLARFEIHCYTLSTNSSGKGDMELVQVGQAQ